VNVMKLRIRVGKETVRVFDQVRARSPPMYEIVCWDPVKKKWVVLDKVGSKREAIEAVRRLRNKCPSGRIDFVREGFTPPTPIYHQESGV